MCLQISRNKKAQPIEGSVDCKFYFDKPDKFEDEYSGLRILLRTQTKLRSISVGGQGCEGAFRGVDKAAFFKSVGLVKVEKFKSSSGQAASTCLSPARLDDGSFQNYGFNKNAHGPFNLAELYLRRCTRCANCMGDDCGKCIACIRESAEKECCLRRVSWGLGEEIFCRDYQFANLLVRLDRFPKGVL